MAGIASWTVGDVQITRIPEFERWSAEALIPAATPVALARYDDWLRPNFIDDDGIVISVQSFVVEASGKRVLIDTGIGNDKVRSQQRLNQLKTPFLNRLSAAGFPAESIDIVFCTHLHTDHVGWNTSLIDGRWVPTFPNARYVLGRAEWEHAHTLRGGDSEELLADSITPLVQASRVEFAQSGHQLTAELRIEASLGHTAGHMSVWVTSCGSTLLITGDAFHHPVQIAEPSWSARNDYDPLKSADSRREIIRRCLHDDVLILGTHFASPVAGRVVSAQGHLQFGAITA
jgi:glyoxylase-like metal-dependent hydrolase (beta-lactamase superfamily II)